MKNKFIFKLFLAAVIIGGVWYAADHYSFQFTVKAAPKMAATASATFSNGKKIRVMIVPAHEPDEGGTQMATPSGEIYERDLAVTIGDDLQEFLDGNGNYQTYVTRTTQAWNPTFQNYFNTNWNAIVSWEQAAKETAMANPAIAAIFNDGEVHNTAPTDDAIRIYGATKWADENDINFMINICVNNYRGNAYNAVGKYTGFVEYYPPNIYDNSSTTKPVAEAVFNRLSLYNPTSDLPIQEPGLIQDPQLIGIGAYNTAKPAAILIEYDYIYEPQFVNPITRPIALKDLAYQTYLGLQDYYTGNTNVTATSSYDPSENIYAWNTPVTSKNSNAEDIYAMQTALIMDGDYPPAGMTRNECPHSGSIGTCTELAVKAFQQKYNITGETIFGSKTFSLLNAIYNGKN